MQEFLALIIEGEPIAKGRPRVAMKGAFPFLYTPKETRAYENIIGLSAKVAMRGRKPSESPLMVEISIYRPIPSSKPKEWKLAASRNEVYPTTTPDADNYAKAILDGCNGIVWHDDAQVIELKIKKMYGDKPRAEMKVFTLAGFKNQDKIKKPELFPIFQPDIKY